jgi:hypothetical protein
VPDAVPQENPVAQPPCLSEDKRTGATFGDDVRIWGAIAVAGFVLLSTTVAFAPPGTIMASLSIDGQIERSGSDKTAPSPGNDDGPPSYLVDLRLIFYSGAISVGTLMNYRDDPRSCTIPVCLAATEEEIVSTAHRALKTRQPDDEDDAEAWDRAIDVWNTSIAGVAALAGISGTAIAYAVGRRKGEASGTKRKTSRMSGGTTAASRSRSRSTVKNTRRAAT